MSIGAPSNLGTILIQRLDAALGITLGQQANISSGAGPQAIPQPGNAENPNALQNPTQRDPRQAVNQSQAEGQRRGTVGNASRELQLANLLGKSATFQGATQSAPTTLGFAARIILALLNQFPHANHSIQGRTPLLPSPSGQPAGAAGGNPAAFQASQASGGTQVWAQLASSLNQPGALSAQFAQALSQSIQGSGLFYEAHLAQLAAGKTSAQALRQEPQGQIPQQSGNTPGAPAQQSAQPASLSSIVQQSQLPQGDAQTAQNTNHTSSTTNHTSATGQTATHTQASIPAIDPQAQMMVRQQLEVLANQGFIWQGEAWPGAEMEWEVQRRQPDDGQDPAVEQEHWATRLVLQLPTLGEVQARLSLSGDQLVMRLVAPESADRLSQAIEPLRSRLLAQGLRASQLSVLHQDVGAEDLSGKTSSTNTESDPDTQTDEVAAS